MVKYETQLPASNPQFIGVALLANLLPAARFSDGMDQFVTTGIQDSN
jgi:hypothetical protein